MLRGSQRRPLQELSNRLSGPLQAPAELPDQAGAHGPSHADTSGHAVPSSPQGLGPVPAQAPAPSGTPPSAPGALVRGLPGGGPAQGPPDPRVVEAGDGGGTSPTLAPHSGAGALGSGKGLPNQAAPGEARDEEAGSAGPVGEGEVRTGDGSGILGTGTGAGGSGLPSRTRQWSARGPPRVLRYQDAAVVDTEGLSLSKLEVWLPPSGFTCFPFTLPFPRCCHGQCGLPFYIAFSSMLPWSMPYKARACFRSLFNGSGHGVRDLRRHLGTLRQEAMEKNAVLVRPG